MYVWNDVFFTLNLLPKFDQGHITGVKLQIICGQHCSDSFQSTSTNYPPSECSLCLKKFTSLTHMIYNSTSSQYCSNPQTLRLLLFLQLYNFNILSRLVVESTRSLDMTFATNKFITKYSFVHQRCCRLQQHPFGWISRRTTKTPRWKNLHTYFLQRSWMHIFACDCCKWPKELFFFTDKAIRTGWYLSPCFTDWC